MIDNLKIIQHNVLTWTPKRSNELCNLYRLYDPDIILLNSMGMGKKVKIQQYNVYARNTREEEQAGIAIAIKKGIKHKLLDEANGDLLGLELETSRGKILIFTAYAPPRHGAMELQALLNYIRRPIPAYLFADLNARHRLLGHGSTNNMGNILANLIRRGLLTFLGPEFPTFITEAGRGTPDIVLGNQHANLNITLTQGPISTSDHLPIYIRLSTVPIIMRGKKILKISKANWEVFQDHLSRHMPNVNQRHEENKTREEIDQELEQWYTVVKKAIEKAIPSSDSRIMPHPKITDRQKELQRRYTALKQHAERFGWNRVSRIVYRNIHNELRDECSRAYQENWVNLIKNANDMYNDPKTFWRNIGRIMGGKVDSAPYLKNNNGDKIYDDKNKAELFENIWSNIFRISQRRISISTSRMRI